MRLLVANYHAAPVGGVETYLRAVLPHLARSVTAVALLTRESADPGPEGVPVEGVEWLAAAGETPEAVVDTATRWRPDVVYTHGLGAPAFDAALAARFPTVAFMHNYGGSCASGLKRHAAPAAGPCDRPLGAGCLALWWPRQCGGRNPVTMLQMYGDARRRQSTLEGCRGVVVASRHMADELRRNGVPPARVHHVPLFPTAFTADKASPASRPFSGRLLFIGRLTEVKGWRHLLDAWPAVSAALGRPLTLVVAGDGPDRDAFQAECGRRGVLSQFLGWLPPARLEGEMRRCDLLVVPSLWPEPFGLVGLEGGCVGLPAAAFAVGGIPEWLTPGETGELAPGARPRARELADAIVRAVEDPEHWQQLRVGAWHTARRFTADAHLNRLLPVIEAAQRPT
jgi:glycosyltransferase involved in cell wall biosynthesis